MSAHLPRIKALMVIHAHRKVRGLLQGEYASTQVGRSLEFNDLREYVRGDDVRDLDWKASARSGQLLVKRYAANRKHVVLLVVSTGRSMAAVNDALVPKRELAIFVAGVFGWLAVRHGDFVGAAFGDAISRHVRRPTAGEVKLERSLGAIYDSITPDSAPADLGFLLEYVARVVRRRTIMVVISDDPALDEHAEEMLRRARAQHEVLFVTIGDLDPTREDLDVLTDIDTGGGVPEWVHGDPRLAEEYAAMVTTDNRQLRSTLDRLGIAHERVTDHESAISAIYGLLERHRHGRRR